MILVFQFSWDGLKINIFLFHCALLSVVIIKPNKMNEIFLKYDLLIVWPVDPGSWPGHGPYKTKGVHISVWPSSRALSEHVELPVQYHLKQKATELKPLNNVMIYVVGDQSWPQQNKPAWQHSLLHAELQTLLFRVGYLNQQI